MKKEVNKSKEFAITIILVVLGVALLSWVGEKQQISGTVGYSVSDDAQHGKTRGFTPEHNDAWEIWGREMTERYDVAGRTANTNDEITSFGEVVYISTNGAFIDTGDRVLYTSTTESMNVGDFVTVIYKILSSGEISVLSVEKK